MFCKKCGSEIKEGSKFCPKCGTPTGGQASKGKEKFPKWIPAAAAIGIAAVLAAGIWSAAGKDGKETQTVSEEKTVQTLGKAEEKQTGAVEKEKPEETALKEEEKQQTESVEKEKQEEAASGDQMVEMDDPEIQKETVEGREENSDLEVQKNAEITEDNQIYGNYDGYGETPLSDQAMINVEGGISTIEAYGGKLGKNAPKSGYVISVRANNYNNIPCEIYPMFEVSFVSPKYNYESKSMILLDTDAVYAEGGRDVSLEDPTYIKPVTMAPYEERTFLYYLDLESDAPVEMIDSRLFGGFGEKLPLEDLQKHKEEVYLDSENYLDSASVKNYVVKASENVATMKDYVNISDFQVRQVDGETYQVEMTAANDNDFSCNVFPMFGCTATFVVDDWGREETVEAYLTAGGKGSSPCGYETYPNVKVESFRPQCSFGLAAHETKKIYYIIYKSQAEDISALRRNPNFVSGEVKSLEDIRLLDFSVEEAELNYLPLTVLDGLGVKKEAEGDYAYTVYPLVNDTEDRWRTVVLSYALVDEDGFITYEAQVEGRMVDLGDTAELEIPLAEGNEKTKIIPTLLYYQEDNSYQQ